MAKSRKSDSEIAMSALERYRDLIPSDVREDILNRLLEARLKGFQDFIDTTTFVMAHVLVGNIPTDVADTMRGYFELLFTAVSANALSTKGPDGKPRVTAEGILAARNAGSMRLTSNVVLEETPEGLKVDLAMVPVPRNGGEK